MRRRGVLQPIGYQGERRELAKARTAAFADPPVRPNQVWQLDFSEYETARGGIWRLAGVTDYFTKLEHGWHPAPTCTGADAIEAGRIAIAEAERLAGRPLRQVLPVHPQTGEPVRKSWSPTTAGRSRGQRSPGSSPPGQSCCTSAPGRSRPARTGCASAPLVH